MRDDKKHCRCCKLVGYIFAFANFCNNATRNNSLWSFFVAVMHFPYLLVLRFYCCYAGFVPSFVQQYANAVQLFCHSVADWFYRIKVKHHSLISSSIISIIGVLVVKTRMNESKGCTHTLYTLLTREVNKLHSLRNPKLKTGLQEHIQLAQLLESLINSPLFFRLCVHVLFTFN